MLGKLVKNKWKIKETDYEFIPTVNMTCKTTNTDFDFDEEE